MAQVTLGTVTADRRSLRRALRPLLVLGGFAALWWILMTGTAQADSGREHHELRDTLRAATATVHRAAPVTKLHAVRRVVHVTHATTSRTTKTVQAVRRDTAPVTDKVVQPVVTQVVEPVVEPVTALVAETPVAPVVDQVATSVHETAAALLTTVRSASPEPATEPAGEVIRTSVANLESSALAAEAQQQGHRSAAADAAANAAAVPSTDGRDVGSSAGSLGQPSELRSPSRSDAQEQTPAPAPFQTPTSSGHCPSSSASGSGAPTPVAVDEASLILDPPSGADRHLWSVALRSGGPSHLPACSPD